MRQLTIQAQYGVAIPRDKGQYRVIVPGLIIDGKPFQYLARYGTEFYTDLRHALTNISKLHPFSQEQVNSLVETEVSDLTDYKDFYFRRMFVTIYVQPEVVASSRFKSIKVKEKHGWVVYNPLTNKYLSLKDFDTGWPMIGDPEQVYCWRSDINVAKVSWWFKPKLWFINLWHTDGVDVKDCRVLPCLYTDNTVRLVENHE